MESSLWVIPVLGWVFVGISTLGALAILLGLYFLKQTIKTHQLAIQKRFENEHIQLFAGNVNCVRQESQSMAQIRGNGCLVLTQSWEPLHWFPKTAGSSLFFLLATEATASGAGTRPWSSTI